MIVDLDELERRAKQDGFLRQCSSVSHSTMLALIARVRAAEARAAQLEGDISAKDIGYTAERRAWEREKDEYRERRDRREVRLRHVIAQRNAIGAAAEAVVAAWSETAWESDAVMAALDLLENAIAEARK